MAQNALTDFEHEAKKCLRPNFRSYDKIFGICAELGIQVTKFTSIHSNSLRLKLSALFLKRILNDLRGIWLLLTSGYTSQAASIAASLYENALAVQCVANNDTRASKLEKSNSGELPWNIPEMCKMITADESKKFESSLPDDERWKPLYGQYKWLCEIKHPTLRQVAYDAGATSTGKSSYVVATFPDIRNENLGAKLQICLITLLSTHDAIRSFAEGADASPDSEEMKLFETRLNEVEQFIEEQLKDENYVPPPFAIKNTRWGEKHLRELFKNEKGVKKGVSPII